MMISQVQPAINEEMKRISIRLPSWHYKRLIWLAAMKGQAISGMVQNLCQAEIEVSEERIERMLSDRAGDMGISVEELKQRLLVEANYIASDDLEVDKSE